MYILYYIIFLAATKYKKNHFFENEKMRFSFICKEYCHFPFFFFLYFLFRILLFNDTIYGI